MDKDFGTRLTLAFEMWERRYGRPLSDEIVAGWLTAVGHRVSADYVRRLRKGEITAVPAPTRSALAQVFGVDPGYFAHVPVLAHSHDQDVVADFDNPALRHLGRVVTGLSMRTLLYLESVADALRRADGLPPANWTAQI
ncbi:hypothetical protein IU433_10910 [Nocardia puris]|uniref:hypothetical protein n=1 Tax=Nocardia puris TaxID=208602 RepID=UPI0018963BB4|nr:hypothetical protein [Nocardia puris]MBF6211021.1 hypothetical protein [Nocardia puris]MBF6364617.1 hypothetical protein [Nocardia puris]MBF6459546.1 hypothetical protein [Nocardia puris]